MELDIIILFILLLLSGFFSSSELAYVVANKIKIELRARQNNPAAKAAQYFSTKPQIFFSTILISNNIVNIAFASIITVFLTHHFQFDEFTILGISTLLLFLFGELVPKYLARDLADMLVLVSSIPLRVVTFIIYPVVKLTASFSTLLTRAENLNEDNFSKLFDKEDIQMLLNESTQAGRVGEVESDIINKILELREQRVYETMTPRTSIVGIEINSTIPEVIEVFIESGYSKIPVYEENLDNIKGMVYAYDMFKSPENLSSVMREAIFVPETKKSLEMLNELLAKQTSIAIVVDEFGGTAGIVTLEDIIEEMLGEIKDEYDVDDEVCKMVDDFTYVISGTVEIDYINEQFELFIPEGDYETIAGYITTSIGRIPHSGENLTINHFNIMILHSDNKKVNLVKMFVDKEKLEELTTG
ncbi:MAG: hemolysin family protein [Melioribacteraceae bacterium]|nr:hemolysin family protein [Melioribacteraceae bacterium]MCF8395112.1 hemolysin family protein [Melioribacteraceae bacterium]MCF8420521.1 hemolysin family protein [Melioribacteraceae bacterium]